MYVDSWEVCVGENICVYVFECVCLFVCLCPCVSVRSFVCECVISLVVYSCVYVLIDKYVRALYMRTAVFQPFRMRPYRVKNPFFCH